MAKLRVFQTIENDIWKLNFTLDRESLSEPDKQLMQKFGEPSINVGGIFLEDTGNEFTLPDKYVKVESELPFLQEFDSKAGTFSTATETKVTAYRDEFVTRYTDAFTTLRASVDTFTAEKLYDV